MWRGYHGDFAWRLNSQPREIRNRVPGKNERNLFDAYVTQLSRQRILRRVRMVAADKPQTMGALEPSNLSSFHCQHILCGNIESKHQRPESVRPEVAMTKTASVKPHSEVQEPERD